LNKHLIVYVKKPQANHSKTRLGAAIGHEHAAGVYARLVFSYLDNLLQSELLEDVEITLSVADKASAAFFKGAFPEMRVVHQIRGGLGARMQASFDDVFALGCQKAILTGSDIPFLNAKRVKEAFRKLEKNQIVLGPAEDGGYFLIGMQQPGWNVFEEIPWSTAKVLSKTMERIEGLGIKNALLPMGFDVDVAADYHRWLDILNQ